ncbi:PadR family transcriptional regulator [Gordonia bronchialis]|jgi:DNA-binding PadR family transcriptional regulator|uniref:PadR family transcriptional regulator n=1 Tax=Gordonia bronchialis TaxID=2054 RepID=UPI0024304993|nr:PadR family transcriptional regulator [Gordonia bronchialis]
MRSSTTRLLLLGAVGLFEPVNGYQIRRELMSWQADQWANVAPGSIYHGLARLSADGLLTRHDVTEGARDVAVYQLTDAGRTEVQRLIAEAIDHIDIYDHRDFQAAYGLLPMLGADRAVELLTDRHRRFADIIADLPEHIDPAMHPYAPPHALRSLELWSRTARAEFDWLTDLLQDVARGTLSLDTTGWAPPADDPGHQMSDDRRRYREMIGAEPPTSQ